MMMNSQPFRWAFIATTGVLLALLLAVMVVNLHEVLLAVFIAAFVALGLDPAIRFFVRRGMKRGGAILTVILILIAVLVGIVWLVVPPVVTQTVLLIQRLPGQFSGISTQAWFETVNTATNGVAAELVSTISSTVASPNFWASLGGGALQFGLSIANGVTLTIFVFVLSIYFIATIDVMKEAGYSLVNRSQRDQVRHYGDQILGSIGAYLSGMVTLSFINAVFSTILLTIVGVPYAFVFGVLALVLTMIPLIGTVITTTMMTIVALLVSPVAALIVLIVMLVYMQLEAYVLTPRVMSKAVQVPGSVVLISALAGGTLLGLLGALVAIPISAGILLIVKQVIIPARDER